MQEREPLGQTRDDRGVRAVHRTLGHLYISTLFRAHLAISIETVEFNVWCIFIGGNNRYRWIRKFERGMKMSFSIVEGILEG